MFDTTISQSRNPELPTWFYWGIGGLLLLLYGPLLVYWYDGWIQKTISLEHEYFSHGVIGIPLAFYLAWSERPAWQKLPSVPHVAGLGMLALGAVFYFSGLPDLVNISFPIVLTALCLWLKGIDGVKLMAFPLLLIALATPTDLPYLIVNFTLPLQRFIASVAGFILMQLHIDVSVQNIYLFVQGTPVEVAPHCAGLKTLFTNLYFCLIGIYWTGSWQSRSKTSFLIFGAIFISVAINIFRNALLAFFHGTGQDALFHWLHDSWGGDVYWLVTLGFLLLLFNVSDRLWAAASGNATVEASDQASD